MTFKMLGGTEQRTKVYDRKIINLTYGMPTALAADQGSLISFLSPNGLGRTFYNAFIIYETVTTILSANKCH